MHTCRRPHRRLEPASLHEVRIVPAVDRGGPEPTGDGPMVARGPKAKRSGDALRCPSAFPKAGALVIGVVVGPTIAYLSPPPRVSKEALSTAGPDLEQRFRFSLPCSKRNCSNFTDDHCGLIEDLIEERRARVAPSPTLARRRALPSCAIRPVCQWYRSAGAVACTVCPTIRYKSSRSTT